VNASPAPRPGLREVGPYESPQVDVSVRLNANESPLPLPAAFSQDLAAAVRDLPLNRYPDGEMRALREALAARSGHHAIEGIWPANGSNEVLAQLLQAFGGPGRSAAVFEPTYLLHRRLSWLTQTDVVERRLEPPFRIEDGDVAWVTDAAPDVVFVCSPNNPTGTIHPIDTIAALAASANALVIVDEAYGDFGGESALPLLADHANVVVVRTFSKSFALAGARIGYVLASPEVVGDLRRVRLPYHLSALTQAAGVVALRHADEAAAEVTAIREQRDRLLEALSRIDGATVFPSQANFVLFQPPGDAKAIWQGLLDRGVLVRDLTEVVPNALRVTAGTAHEVDLFLKSLDEVLT
jgi:histidinol-phosphate aminotransferase